YLAVTIWPPVVQHFIAASGWRATHTGIGLFLLVSMLPLVYLLRQRMQAHHTEAAVQLAARRQAELPFSPATLQVLLCIAGIACCVAMSMPQVHLVAYCGDLGYGAAPRCCRSCSASASSAASRRGSSPTASAACARCCSARCCRGPRCSSICSSMGSRRST